MSDSHPLPTEQQRARLGMLVQQALVEIRAACGEGKARQAEDLADAFHNIPAEMYGWGSWNPDITRGMLRVYDATYGSSFAAAFDEIVASTSGDDA